MEILAPAGDEAMLRAAVYSGADCVYLGVSGFNARRSAANFDGDALARAVGFCHARNCRVYAAVNTVVLPGQREAALGAIEAVANAGCDAMIVQDLGVARLARAAAPGLPLHGSTQMSVHSPAGAAMLWEQGFARVILGRELSFDEIAAIAAACPIELEVFVHGALCVCLSGQCTMSAFLGGRSANRGACAGPCRLPFAAHVGTAPAPDAKLAPCREEDCHLSLKDLSILDALPQLAALGVSAAKIEGRLRGPDYCAVVVDAAQKALRGEAYDRALVRDIFNRSGFTDGWFTGAISADMFGRRTAADTALARAAAPKARALYRRERPRVPVTLSLAATPDGAALTATDGTHTVRRTLAGPLAPARQEGAEAVTTALGKLGGTPFYAEAPPEVDTGGCFLPGSEVSALRRAALEELLALREAPTPLPFLAKASAAAATACTTAKMADGPLHRGQAVRSPLHTAQTPAGTAAATCDSPQPPAQNLPLLRARFAHVAQLPENADTLCAELLFPLAEAAQVPAHLRHKSRLYLPRTLFGQGEAQAAAQLAETADMGFAGYEAQNVAHLYLCKDLPCSGGFGLNITNADAVAAARDMGCDGITLSPELSLRQMRQLMADDAYRLAADKPTGETTADAGHAIETGAKTGFCDALCYGHLPMMVTRACPLMKARGKNPCAGCPRTGYLVDRKGAAFPVSCHDGARTILNPIPLWMADRLRELGTHTATLYFTLEDRRQAAMLLAAFAAGEAAPGAFTRGLYDKGTVNPE